MEHVIINIDTQKNIYKVEINGKKIEFSKVFNVCVRPRRYQTETSYMPLSKCEDGKKVINCFTPIEYELSMDIGTVFEEHFLDGRLLDNDEFESAKYINSKIKGK